VVTNHIVRNPEVRNHVLKNRLVMKTVVQNPVLWNHVVINNEVRKPAVTRLCALYMPYILRRPPRKALRTS
jgi:hypothetical protein